MNKTKLECSINDTTNLRKLILENPELPVLIFCGESAWSGEYPYEMQTDDLSEKEEYKDLTDEEYEQMIDKKVAETEFVKAIVIHVG